MIEHIFDLITRETSDEIINREVKMLAAILNCKINDWETAAEFSSVFDGLFSKYIHTMEYISDESIKKWEIVMLQNSNLSTVTHKAIEFKLTSKATINTNKDDRIFPTTNLEMNAIIRILTQILKTDKQNEITALIEDFDEVANTMKEKRKEPKEDKRPSLKLED